LNFYCFNNLTYPYLNELTLYFVLSSPNTSVEVVMTNFQRNNFRMNVLSKECCIPIVFVFNKPICNTVKPVYNDHSLGPKIVLAYIIQTKIGPLRW
jgi:hypothetical protein